ncbi:MAG: hypothetical protein RLZZ46_1148 [Bacteroidota bacterium]|jgi:tRNA threonylcarbamoyladenosine biosynthesis protein TsaE
MKLEREAGETEIDEIAELLLPYLNQHRLLLLYGEPGCGKTTLVRALMQITGYRGNVQSPTFSLVNQYNLESGNIVYHFDLYRLSGQAEADEAGISEMLVSGGCSRLVEWPERLHERNYEDAVTVRIFYKGERRLYLIEDKKTV